MTVSLAPIGGAASQFFNSGGVPLYGGKIYTYEAGTTTPKATYTEANGLTAHPNPIILNSAGRVPGGEIWLTSAQAYLFILKNSSDETIGTYDNIYGINAGGANAVTETQVATAGQTSFTLTSMTYTPGVFTLGVYIDGVNQVVNNSYVETSATTVTFVSGLHVGAVVKFVNINSAATDSNVVSYLPAGAGAVPTTVQAKLRESVSVKDFGAVGDGVTDDTNAIDATKLASTAVNFPAGNYRLNVYPNYLAIAKTIRGEGLVNLNWYHTSAIAWATFATDTQTENIRFVCTEPKEGLRASVEYASRVTLRNCHFEGFNNGPINDGTQDAWGLFIQHAADVTVDSCTFANNGNTDIAIVDNVDNLTIINPSNTTTGTVSFNVEPNTTKGVHGMNVIGGRFNKVALQENNNQYYASKNIVFTGASIDTLLYDGSGVEFQNCAITALTNSPDGLGNVYGGQLIINNASLGKNLIDDPYFFDVIGSGSVAYWAVGLGGAATIARQNDADGKYLRLNSTKAAGYASVSLRTDIAVTPSETLIVALRARVDNTGTGAADVEGLAARWLTSGGATISETVVKCCRTLVGTNSGWKTDVGVLIPPATAAKVRIYVNTQSNGVSIDASHIGLYRPTLNVEGGDWASVIGNISTPVTENEYQQSAFPTGAFSAGYFVGERIKNSAPAVGQPKAWVCTVAGAPGTWVSEGNL